MKFIPLSELKQLTAAHGNVLEEDERMNIIEYFTAQQADSGTYSSLEIVEVARTLSAEKIVFYGWIDQNSDLVQLLKGQLPIKEFKDSYFWLDHALFSSFSAFLTPFLVKTFLALKDEKGLLNLQRLFSYLPLMRMDERMVVEQELFKNIHQLSNDLFLQSEKAKNENELLPLTEQICSAEIIDIINHLSRASYHLKVGYIDKVLNLFEHPHCTPRLGYRIVKKLHALDLNPGHQTKLKNIEAELKSGQLLQGKVKPKRRINYRQIVSLAVLVGLIFLAYTVFTTKTEVPNNTDLNTASSFEKFTKEERIQLDSLLRSKRGSIDENQDDRDKYLWSQGNGTSLTLRSSLQNNRMEELYADWLIDVMLHENGAYDSCRTAKNNSTNFLFPGVKKASELIGKDDVYIQNNSEYSVYVFIFDDFNNGMVYSQLFKKGETIHLKLTVGNNLLFVAGKNIVKYIVPKNTMDVPSQRFDHHFCEVDDNFKESLFTIYKLAKPKKGQNKLMLSGDSTNYFVVADLYGILETN